MMRSAVFLSSPQLWSIGHGPDHPLKPERLQRTFELLRAYGAFSPPHVRVIAPQNATDEELAYFHTPEYILVVNLLSQGRKIPGAFRYGFGNGHNPIFSHMRFSEGLKVGSALTGAELLVRKQCDIAFSYNGGLHHSGPNIASGFCVFNDVAVAIQWLLQQGLRIAYVDIDLHHGDGVQFAFYDTDKVLTIDLHQDGCTLFPGTGGVTEMGIGSGLGYSVNVPLPSQTGDETYLWAFQQIVPPLLDRFHADILVTQLGVDTHFLDPLAKFSLTTNGHRELFAAFSQMAPLWLAFGGGGGDLTVVPRSWTLAWEVMSGQSFPEELPRVYREKYGGDYLRDPLTKQVEPSWVRDRVEKLVSQLKKLHHI